MLALHTKSFPGKGEFPIGDKSNADASLVVIPKRGTLSYLSYSISIGSLKRKTSD
jgi:hypothetical protein